MKRKHARVDANHAEIVTALRAVGCSVQSLAAVGCGVPDLLVSRRGSMWLIEVKDGSKCPSKRRLTDDEERWHYNWKAEIHTCHSVEEALSVVNL